MSEIFRAWRRLWRLATCPHRNAMSWGVGLRDLSGAPVEIHFCRRCGRLLWACRSEDQPQHNRHWLTEDHLDNPVDRAMHLPHIEELADLVKK